MLIEKILTKACRILTAFVILMIVATFPAIAAEEGGNDVLELPEGRIKSILKSEVEKNPDVKSCKIIVTIDFQRDLYTDNWKGCVDDVWVSTEGFNVADTEEKNDDVSISDDGVSANDSYESDSNAGNNVIIWLLGISMVAILLMIFFPTLKKFFQRNSTLDNCTNNRSNASKGSPINNAQKPYSRHNNSYMDDSDRFTKLKKPTERIDPAQQTAKSTSAEVINSIDSVSEDEESQTVMEEQCSEPVTLAKSIVKYGQIAVLSQDELVTENDYMSDNAAGMPFEFNFFPSMEEGTYDIASSSRQSFLSDVNMIRPYVQDFDALTNPSMIVTISKGKLRKRGMQWVVTEKAKIELK